MYIKVLCPCGVKFGFDVEPVNGVLPAAIACPGCAADATALANQSIAQASAPAAAAAPVPSAAPRLKLAGHAPHEETAAPASAPAQPEPAPVSAQGVSPVATGGGLKLSRSSSHAAPAPAPKPASEPAAAPEDDGSLQCEKHHEAAGETCRMCGKPICPKCMESFGYVCSAYCRRRADDEGVILPVYGNQRSERMATERRSANKLFAVAGGVAVVLGIAWLWYEFSGSQPKLALTLGLAQGGGSSEVVLVDSTRFAVVNSTQAAMHDFNSGDVQWTVQLPAAAPAGAGRFDDDFGYGRKSFAAAGDVWVAASGKLLRLAADNGAIKSETPLKGRVFSVEVQPWAAVVRAGSPSGGQTLLQVSRETGDVKSFDVGASPGGSGSVAAAGDSAVQMNVRLMEKRIVMKDTMKDTERRVAPGSVSTGRSLEAMQDVINEMNRDIGETKVKVDESRYEVTLRRIGGAGAADWKGEVIGEPALFALKNLDVVAGGQELHVFDKSNRRLWGAKLSFALSAGAGISAHGGGMGGFFGGALRTPFVETDDTLFASDAGTLIAFDRASGEARWRVPLVGISSMHLGDDGNLYVAATTATADAILYPDQVNLMEKVRQVIAKVRAKDGKVVWQSENRGPELVVSGKYVYAGASSTAGFAAMIQGRREASENFNLYRLSASSGRDVWHLHQPGYASQVEAVGKRILLQFPGEVRGFKYL